VGLFLAALYRLVWTNVIAPADFASAVIALLLLASWSVPPWLVVVLGANEAQGVAMLVDGI
jgi:chromate transporter